MKRHRIECQTWDYSWKQIAGDKTIKGREEPLEQAVSRIIRQMPFLWVALEGETGRSKRRYIESNAIALLSNYRELVLDPTSGSWLGRWSVREKVQHSGLWNSHYVKHSYKGEFLDILESAVDAMRY